MCGLIGVFGDVDEKIKRAFKLMHNFDTLRGEDSSGLCAVKKNHDTEIMKEIGVPAYLHLMHQDRFDRGVLKGNDVLAMIGHNRFKTQGAINAENAHPFEFENVIGAHNGTIIDFYTRDLHDGGKYEIDSQRIYSQLNHDGDVSKLWEMLPDSQSSAAALTWWDKRDNSMNFIRNTQRPLYMASCKKKQAILWASEEWMIEFSAARTDLEIGKIISLESNNHVKLKMGDKNAIEMSTNKVKPKVFPAVHYTSSGGGHNWVGGSYHERKEILVLKEVHENAIHPALIFTRADSSEVICEELYPTSEKVVAAMQELIEDFGGEEVSIEVPVNSIYNLGAGTVGRLPGNKVSAFEVMRAIKLEKSYLANADKIVDLKPSNCVVTDHTGGSLSGRVLRKRLRNAGNLCSNCLSEMYPKTPEASGGTFVSETEFLCSDCVSLAGYWSSTAYGSGFSH